MEQAPSPASAPVVETFLACLKNARHETRPFDYWLLDNALSEQDCDDLASLPVSPPEDAVFDGRRESNNALRVYFTPENQAKFDVCRRVVEGFKAPSVKSAIEGATSADLSDSHLRIEYCQDNPGFWLEPHTDIFVKKFTMLVYLSDNPDLATAGTNIHEGPPDFKYVGSAPYGKNKGVIFIPGKNTWHGVGHDPIKGLRKSIIINYVTSDWRDKWQFA